MFVIYFFVGLLIGLSAGIWFADLNYKEVGTLKIDESDPDDGPYLFLEIPSNPNVLKKYKYITLKVDVDNYVSR